MKGFPKAMVIAFTVIVAILVAELVFVLANGTAKSTATAQEETPVVSTVKDGLQVSGTLLTCNGQEVVFRGLSFGWHNIWPRFYNASAVNIITSYSNCRLLRAAIGADGHAKADNPDCHDGYIDDPDFALDCLYKVVDAAIANKCYIIVDWHSHVLHFEEARDFFTKVATRYAESPYVIYELFNEPISQAFEEEHSYSDLGNPEAMAFYWKELKAYGEALIDVITSISTVHPLILMGCPCWDQRVDLPASNPITSYDNLMYTLHFYAATHKESLRDAATATLAAGIPLFISECAASEASGDGEMDMEQWRLWNEWAASNGVSMVTWSISDKNETCSMAYPEAASEGPWDFDDLKPWGKIVYNWLSE